MERGRGGKDAAARCTVAGSSAAGIAPSRGDLEDRPVLGSCVADQPASGAGCVGRSPTSPCRHGLRSHTEMLDQFTNLEDGDLALPTSSLDLSTRMRDLRARQGLKQSEVARRMGLDPSIPSLWEQGKRLVPANRVRSLADALEVSVEELLDGISGAQRAPTASAEVPLRATTISDLIDERAVLRQRAVAESGPLLRLLPQAEDSAPTAVLTSEASPEPWVVPQR